MNIRALFPKLQFAALVLPMLFMTSMPADALTREQAQDECRRLNAAYTNRDAARTGVTRQQNFSRCVQEKMGGKKKR